MPKAWVYDEACRVVGELYGNILGRDSDPDGYQYAVEQLSRGYESVRDIARRFCTSEEFREKYVMNQTPNELARRLLIRLGRHRRAEPDAIKALAVALLERDWREVISEMIDSPAFFEAFGDDHPPLWV